MEGLPFGSTSRMPFTAGRAGHPAANNQILVAPSTQLRKWFSHDPAKWKGFRRRYRAELDQHPEAWQPLLQAATKSDLTLPFSSHDTAHNNALVLKAYLEAKQSRQS